MPDGQFDANSYSQIRASGCSSDRRMFCKVYPDKRLWLAANAMQSIWHAKCPLPDRQWKVAGLEFYPQNQGGSAMLVLSRKLGEKIAIDGEIELEVLALSGNRVRLGIVAPDDCRIMRAERLPPAD